MNLLKLIGYLSDITKLEEFLKSNYPNIDIDYVDIYFIKEINIKSLLMFFDAEKLEGKLEFEQSGVKYINLFPLDYLIEIYESLKDAYKTDIEIANRIVEYRINNA